MKNVIRVSTESLVIVGNNFISDSLYKDYRRNGKMKVLSTNNLNSIKNKPNYIIDCSLDPFKQNQSVFYCNSNDIKKLLIINRWERTDFIKTDLIIIQAIIYDIYSNNHDCFNRQGFGNSFDEEIDYCNVICESIRRIHESKQNFIPITYIPYSENKIKYTHVNNLYEPINYMLLTMNKKSTYSVYDDEKGIYNILYSIKEVIGYNGEFIVLEDNPTYRKPIKSLDFNFKKSNLNTELKRIYNYLLNNNQRFKLVR